MVAHAACLAKGSSQHHHYHNCRWIDHYCLCNYQWQVYFTVELLSIFMEDANVRQL